MNAFLKERRRKGREKLDGSLLAKVPKSYKHNQKSWCFLHILRLSLGQRETRPSAPASGEKLAP